MIRGQFTAKEKRWLLNIKSCSTSPAKKEIKIKSNILQFFTHQNGKYLKC